MVSYHELFKPKAVIGMIHLAGENSAERIERAVAEMDIYRSESVNGVIIEDYHGTVRDIEETLKHTKPFRETGLRIGINVLRDPLSGFELAREFGAQFVQLDSVQFRSDLEFQQYKELRARHPDVLVFGGVRFKYQPPTGKSLEQDIEDALPLCDAVVTTGEGTGIETPLEKLAAFRKCMLSGAPLVVGAGVNAKNIESQFEYADCAIIGSAFKPNGNTHEMVDRDNVRDIMNIMIYGVRGNYARRGRDL